MINTHTSYTVIWDCPYNGKQTFEVEPGIMHLLLALCVHNKQSVKNSSEGVDVSVTIPLVGKLDFIDSAFHKKIKTQLSKERIHND